MLEGQVLAVQVGQEMLGAFGKVQDGFQVDDFGTSGCHIREAAGEQLQEIEVAFSFFGFHSHMQLLLNV